MSLMQDWENIVAQYSQDAQSQQKFWTNYYLKEKEVYEQLLTQPVEVVTGTVKELAENAYDEYYKTMLTLSEKMGSKNFAALIDLLDQANTILLEEKNNG